MHGFLFYCVHSSHIPVHLPLKKESKLVKCEDRNKVNYCFFKTLLVQSVRSNIPMIQSKWCLPSKGALLVLNNLDVTCFWIFHIFKLNSLILSF